MYYPYLRGKQFELIALREFADIHHDLGRIIPIIEPVKTSLNGISNAVSKFVETNFKYVLVVNPQEGDFAHGRADVGGLLRLIDNTPGRPALLYRGESQSLIRLIQEYQLDDVMIVALDGFDFVQDAHLEELVMMAEVADVVNGNATIRRTSHRFSQLEVPMIKLENKFNVQKRNVDYQNPADEIFTEEPFYDDFPGFADYTVLSKDFSEGGALPYAIAIHLTYDRDQIVYVHHFVSDTNFNQQNIQGKFHEAAEKAVTFFYEYHPNYFKGSALDELRDYYETGRYPGLGMLKKISIKHHLELVSHILLSNDD